MARAHPYTLALAFAALAFLPGPRHLIQFAAYRLGSLPVMRRRLEWLAEAQRTNEAGEGSFRRAANDYIALNSGLLDEIWLWVRAVQTAFARAVQDRRRRQIDWRVTPADYQRDLEARLQAFEGFEWGRRFRDTLIQQLGDFSTLQPHELFIMLTRHYNNLLRDRIAQDDPLGPMVEAMLMDVLRDMRDDHVPRPLQNSR